MATFKLHIARVRGCPAPEELDRAIEEFGLPEHEEFGVLDHSLAGPAVHATIVHRTQQTVQRLDRKAKDITPTPVEKAAAYPFAVNPAREVLEIYAGPPGAIEQVGVFFSSCLALPALVEPIELDVLSAVRKLEKNTERFQLRSARVSEYAHNSFMSGPYTPKFLDNQHGLDFLEEYADYVTAAAVRFAAPAGRITVRLTTKACFSLSRGEEDHPTALSVLRKLI